MKPAEIQREKSYDDGGRDSEMEGVHLQAKTHQGLRTNTHSSELRETHGSELPSQPREGTHSVNSLLLHICPALLCDHHILVT